MEIDTNISETPASPASTGDIIDVTAQSFMEDVITASDQQLVLLDLWAPWCGPCKQLTPILENAVKASNGAVRLAKMNIDEHPEVAQQLQVQSIPAVFAFKNQRPVDAFMGAQSESQVKDFIERHIGEALGASPEEQIMEAAQMAFAEGDITSASQAYAHILQENPAHIKAIAGLAQCHIQLENYDEARAVLEMASSNGASDPDIAAALAALELSLKTEDVSELAPLQNALAENPNDHQTRFDLALAHHAAGQKKQAIEALLEIITRNRNWNEEAARKQLLELFDAYGAADEVVIDGRRRLSSILFS